MLSNEAVIIENFIHAFEFHRTLVHMWVFCALILSARWLQVTEKKRIG